MIAKIKSLTDMVTLAPQKTRADDLTSRGFMSERGFASTRLASALH